MTAIYRKSGIHVDEIKACQFDIEELLSQGRISKQALVQSLRWLLEIANLRR